MSPDKRDISIDFLRGLILLIMLLDHVRDGFYAADVGRTIITTTNPSLFFTRWITNFCAPIFIFLSGLSIFLNQQKNDFTPKEISKFIVKRGLFLIFLEFTLISYLFNESFIHNDYTFYAQVIWAIGMAMIFLSLLIIIFRKNYSAILAIALIIIFTHNLFDKFSLESNMLWNFLHIKVKMAIVEDKIFIRSSYPLIPIFGIMSLGYYLGAKLYLKNVECNFRRKYFLKLALFSLFLFIILRYFNIYGDPNLFDNNLLSFLNTSKYPMSLQFSLMTLSMAFFILSLQIKENKTIKTIANYGKASLFFYLLHLVIITILYKIFYKFDIKIVTLLEVYLLTLAIAISSYYLVIKFIEFRKNNLKRYKWLSYI
jgi:uncharacterized membrane protein